MPLFLLLALAAIALPAAVAMALPGPAKSAILARLRRHTGDVRPHQFVRYAPVSALLGHGPMGTLLEIGSGPAGITLLRPDLRIVGCDLEFYRRPNAGVMAVRGSADALPFRDQSFDEVVSVEMLEETRPEEREGVLSEMVRVARRRLIVTTPWGGPGDRLHRDLYRWLTVRDRKPSGWLVRLQSVPSPDESVLEAFRNRSDLRVTVVPGFGRVPCWWLLRLEQYFATGVLLQLLLPIARGLFRAGRGSLRWGESYEKIVVVERILVTHVAIEPDARLAG